MPSARLSHTLKSRVPRRIGLGLGFVLHPRVIEPVIEVRIERHRFVVTRDRKEIALRRLDVRIDVHAHRRVQVVIDRQDVLHLEPGHVLRDGGLAVRAMLLGIRIGFQLGQAAIAFLFEAERRMRTRELAIEERHLFVPGHRNEEDVLQGPGVVLLADARRAGLRRRLAVEPADEVVRRRCRRLDRSLELGTRLRGGLCEGREVRDLRLHRAGACDPKVVRIAGEVEPRLLEERRNDRDRFRELLLVGVRERKRIHPELHDVVMRRPLVRGRVALLGPDRLVIRRVALPGPQHAKIELHAVEIRAHEGVVDLLVNRP